VQGSWIEGLVEVAGGLRTATIGAYATAFVGFAARAAVRARRVDRLALRLAVAGVALHTGYLLVRWVTAGALELSVRLNAGDVLDLADRAFVFVSHPPYTNLFDALNFVGWALVVCWLAVEARFSLRMLGPPVLALSLLAMGEASLVTDSTIQPLVPALQSYWILIHVAMLFISYSLFTLAAMVGVLHLAKCGVHTAVLVAVQAGAAALLLALTGGGALLAHARFELAPSFSHQISSLMFPGKLLTVESAVHDLPQGAARAIKLLVPVPGVGAFLLGALALFVVATVLALRAVVNREPDAREAAPGARALGFAFAVLTFGLGLVLAELFRGAAVELPAGVHLAPGEHGPFHFRAGSNYSLGLLGLVWGTSLATLLLVRYGARIAKALPEARRLDDATYRLVIAGWPLLTVGIVMGGMWANEAWGRFWGWDPKETWALITWVVYAGYLHARITLGWTGKRPAAIAVAAFAVVVFTFMGVNLGLTGEGLHSYGAG
jgi:ABC-type transport system involved in cytochrome c biogenesis permease subunit